MSRPNITRFNFLLGVFLAMFAAGCGKPDFAGVAPDEMQYSSDPFERSLQEKDYYQIVRLSETPTELVGPLIADIARVRETTAALEQQIGAVRGDTIEFGGRERPVTHIYSAVREKRPLTILRTDDMVFYFAAMSDSPHALSKQYFLVTEKVGTDERAEFLLK